MKLGKCKIELCQKQATFGIYRGSGEDKDFVFVCGTHEHLIAADNLKRKRQQAEIPSLYGKSIRQV